MDTDPSLDPAVPHNAQRHQQSATASKQAHGVALSVDEVKQATELLSHSAMFHSCDVEELRQIATRMKKRIYQRGDDIVTQDTPTNRFWLMADGFARRLRTEQDGVRRHVDTKACGGTISSLHVVSGTPTYATARCVTRSCETFTLSRTALLEMLNTNPTLSIDVIASLSAGMRQKRLYRTPLLQQKTQDVNYLAVTIAATVESYYRSALNSLIIRNLSGVASPLFPNMHVQIPTRIAYINGFKGLRGLLDRNVDTDSLPTHNARAVARFAVAVAPGLLMTPVSAILEASNAGHANSEPLLRRSLRGNVPRGAREVLFGIGLNQMSDYFEERYRTVIASQPLANSCGSMTAGVVSGYLSHVPHNLSTFKLLNPHKSYRQVFEMFVDKSAPSHFLPAGIHDALRQPLRTLVACIFPRGLLVRTTQICGSFVVLNGIINMIEKDQRRQVESEYTSSNDDSAENSIQEPLDGPPKP